jgi:hypothetical protein
MLITKKSGGRIQQPLCAAVTERLYMLISDEYTVATKKVFAGDAQSKTKGDVQIKKNDQIVCVLEIKAHHVDNTKVIEVLNDHGQHNYTLVVVAESFHKDIEKRENLTFCTIHDYITTTLSHISAISHNTLDDVARQVLERYNEIMITIEDKPDLCVAF